MCPQARHQKVLQLTSKVFGKGCICSDPSTAKQRLRGQGAIRRREVLLKANREGIQELELGPDPADPDGREDVYYVKFPFVGLERVEDIITFYGLELPETLTQHCAILIHSPQLGVSYA